ncbi:serine hydrolase [Propionibacteriaceae bacterium Y2011]
MSHTAHADDGAAGRFDRPLDGYTDFRTLKRGRPQQVGLDPAPLERGWAEVVSHTTPVGDAPLPLYPSAVLSCAHQGRVVLERWTGYSHKYADGDTELPRNQWIEAGANTIYDMASVSKLFTSIVVMQQVEQDLIDLDTPVAHWLPAFAANGKETVTPRMLLTHTSGFTSWIPLYSRYPDVESRIAAVLDHELANPPGSTYLYSDLNLITLGVLCEHVSGRTLDQLVADGITSPLRMRDTGYNPPATKRNRVAATEFQATPDRGMVWGEVHDENAWSLGGVAGHAGIFSTAGDMAILAQTMLNGGAYAKERILSEDSVTAMISNENTEFPGDDHGLGFELNQRWYMAGLSSSRTAGHTGYTGTSLVIDFASASFVILLTNRVHPSRSSGSVNPARRSAANAMADALGITPAQGESMWLADETPDSTSTLDLTAPTETRGISFSLFLDVESSDPFTLEVSTDAGETWTFLPYTLDGESITGPIGRSGTRAWQQALAAVPEPVTDVGVLLRLGQNRDTLYDGRGLLVDAIRLLDGAGEVVADVEADPSLATVAGWRQVRR